jgi:hypothetical protein
VDKLLLYVFGPLVFASALLVIARGIHQIIARFRSRLTPAQINAASQAYRDRLLHPQQAQVEAELGALLPERLMAIYADKELVLNEGFDICPPGKDPKKSSLWIEDFLPLDWEGQQYTCDLELLANAKGFCFARDGCGNFYWVPVSDIRQPDSPVFFACHDPWGNEKLADSLEEFLSWPRFSHEKD